MRVDLADVQKKNIENTIVISGAPRSGTTLLGRLVSTMANVEYHYEPPTFWMICGLLAMKAVDPQAAEWLLRFYLHEELLCESVSGRRANLRPTDDSLVLNSIHWPDLMHRMTTVRNRDDALRYIAEKGSRLAIKMPSVIDAMPLIAQALPRSQYIIIVRNGWDVVASVKKKGWLSDEGLKNNYYPYKMVDGIRVPHLVEDEHAQDWIQWSAVTRACYLWRRDTEFSQAVQKSDFKGRVFFMPYEKLISTPEKTLGEVSQFISADFTDLTKLGILAIKTDKEVGAANARALAAECDPEQLRQFQAANAVWGYRA
ncbi:MAG: sulfotransferase [Rhizobiales bacterium]|nr:sulfotransferase [Hyphomicrobiales bacterium]OJY43019.1 MAG: hypothetical protein BGP08_20260 [Rhizobiales bacterium 64-17]